MGLVSLFGVGLLAVVVVGLFVMLVSCNDLRLIAVGFVDWCVASVVLFGDGVVWDCLLTPLIVLVSSLLVAVYVIIVVVVLV